MTNSAGGGSARDFFVSYTQADRAWAEWIAWLLEEDGYRVLVQAWDMVAGSNWISRIDQGVRRAARTVAVLSPDYLSSVYGTAEWQAAWAEDQQGQQRKLITVRVRGDWPTGLLAGVVAIDLVGLSEAAARRRLRDDVRAAVRGRAKPDSPPPYPLALRAIPAEPRFPGALLKTAEFERLEKQDPVETDPWHHKASPVPRQLPAHSPHFVGRAAELHQLNALLDSATQDANTVVISAINGTAGIGKTALAVHWANRAAARFPDGQLYVNLRGFGPTGEPMQPAEAVRGFLDAFEVPPGRIPVNLDAQAALYRSLLADRRVLTARQSRRSRRFELSSLSTHDRNSGRPASATSLSGPAGERYRLGHDDGG